MGGPYSQLTLGMNLKGFGGSINMKPGQALMTQDMLERDDGAIHKHWSWLRKQLTALAHRPIALHGMSYKGKNNDTAANPGRSGNFGILDDGPIFTVRTGLYSTCIVLTEGECRYWDPATQAFAGPVALPGGVSIAPNPKPTVVTHRNNAYIVGWADSNLRYDPVDRALYEWGWENPGVDPTLAGGSITVAAGGTLTQNATYRYRASYVNLYTGEESGLGPEIVRTTTTANRTVNFAAGAFPAYAGLRHFVGAGTDQDVGLVVWRTAADGHAFYFLDLIFPALAAATLVDNGLATDFSLKADVRVYSDAPLLNQLVEADDMWLGISWEENTSRFYFNDFRTENSFWERFDVRNHKELALDEGEILIAMARADRTNVALSNLDAYEVASSPSSTTGLINWHLKNLDWGVGCVAPKGQQFIDGHLYFLSDRGPYRWLPKSAKPEWIGRDISPLFIDPSTGLCQLNEALRLEAEIEYDQDARQVRWIFACGPTMLLNRHLMYWIDADKYNGSGESAWKFASSKPQCMDNTQALGPLVGGEPITAFDKRGRLIFGDEWGYVSEYDPSLGGWRGGLPAAVPADGTAQAGSGLNLIVTTGGLWTTGDGMQEMRLEIEYLDGTIDVRQIASNTGVNIVPTSPFSQDPTGALWYVAGIPAYWRSWVDHEGDPKAHKTLIHLYVGYNREFPVEDRGIDVSVSWSGDWPMVRKRARFARLDRHRDKQLISGTGRYFTYEFANSRPDEPFLLSYFETEMIKTGGIRRG